MGESGSDPNNIIMLASVSNQSPPRRQAGMFTVPSRVNGKGQVSLCCDSSDL